MNNSLSAIIEMCIAELGLKDFILSLNEWQTIINSHMSQVGVGDYNAYYRLLIGSNTSFQQLLELIVVRETWFMREKEGLAYIPDFIRRLKNSPDIHIPFFSILSLPCSSGEEAYSISMLLQDAGFLDSQYRVDGVDVSREGIQLANRATYGNNSFRNTSELFKHSYFDREGDKLRVKEGFRKNVHFSCENVLTSHKWKDRGLYDVIVCRNFFLYLHPKAQKKLSDDFKHLLKPHGLLIVGASELETFKSFGFVPFGRYKNCSMKLKSVSEDIKGSSDHVERNLWMIDKRKEVKQISQEKILERAKQAANEGRFNEAMRDCSQYLLHDNQNPEVYYLMGLIHHANHEVEQAKDFFRKALYLDPYHHDTLIYMALLEEMVGKSSQAEALRRRADGSHIKKGTVELNGNES